MKYYYKIYGLILESDYEFHQFVKADEDLERDVDIRIIHGNIRKDIADHIAENHNVGFYEDGMWFKNQVGSFWIHDKSEINFVENEGISIDDAAVFLPGLCLSILLWQRGDIMIHGACLRYKEKTIVISGNSGAGKSTLTTELIKNGAKLLADDVTCIRNCNGIYMSYPAFPAQKLCDDQIEKNGLNRENLKQISYDLNKYEVVREEVFFDEARKADVFFRVEIQDADELKKEEVIASEKLKVIIDSIFINWIFNDAFKLKPEDFMNCAGFANQIQMKKIVRPRNGNTLKDIVDYINQELEEDN